MELDEEIMPASLWNRLLETAADLYDDIKNGDGFNTDDLYNEEAPAPWVSFMIGGIFSAIGVVYWMLRVRRLKNLLNVPLTKSISFRIFISALIDNDEPAFTICKMAAQSFLFLGGLQLEYRVTFSVMLGFFAIESSLDSLRILMAFAEATSLDDLVVTSERLKTQLKNKQVTQLKPNNVYEDLSRSKTIVLMVFITQCLLIAFVVTDIYDSPTHSCRDGTPNCPVVGTFGSWGFYVLGIFMADVFLLGPKTNFGQSEQNPTYWLKLLLVAKTNVKCTWYDPVIDETLYRNLKPSDWRIWIRFLMTFLINGVGFHILVHALPIQVASQSSLTGIVFRAVGMMYLVDLDDTPGYTLTLVDQEKEDKKEEGDGKNDEEAVVDNTSSPPPPQDAKPTKLSPDEVAAITNQILQQAQDQLRAISEQYGTGNLEHTLDDGNAKQAEGDNLNPALGTSLLLPITKTQAEKKEADDLLKRQKSSKTTASVLLAGSVATGAVVVSQGGGGGGASPGVGMNGQGGEGGGQGEGGGGGDGGVDGGDGGGGGDM